MSRLRFGRAGDDFIGSKSMMIDRIYENYLGAADLQVEIWVVFKHWIPTKMGRTFYAPS
jgi:hypothetical protein